MNNVVGLTGTKRKNVLREAASLSVTNTVAWDWIERCSSRNHLTPENVAEILRGVGYICAEKPTPAGLRQKEAKEETVPRIVVEMILNCSSFKILSGSGEVDPEQVFVVTTLAKLTREREAIRKILMGAKIV